MSNLSLSSLIFCLCACAPLLVDSYIRRNVEPLNIGFIFSMPYDISNTLRAPLAGPLSLALGAGLALIMFFGLLVSPIYYIFGLPPRRYGIHDAEVDWKLDTKPESWVTRALDSGDGDNLLFSMRDNSTDYENQNQIPEFLESAFLLIPEEEEQCKMLMVCHAHGFLKFLPDSIIKFYKFFSRKISTIPNTHKSAITIGLEDQSECGKIFNKCSKDIVSISKSTFQYLMSQVLEVQGVADADH